MPQFNRHAQIAKSWNRAARAVKRGKPQQETLARFSAECASIAAIEKVVDWCASRGYKVVLTKVATGLFVQENKTIKLNHSLLPEKMLFILLHECGHLLIGSSEKTERFSMGYHMQEDKDVNETFHHKCDIVEEEYEAWHRGYKLSKRLKLFIDKQRYDSVRVEMLRSYMEWALKVGGFADDKT